MSSPLFRWTFETTKKPFQRTDSEETFYEETKEVWTDKPEPKNGRGSTRTTSEVSSRRNSFCLDDEIQSQGRFSPSVAREDCPSVNSTTSGVDFSVRNNAKKTNSATITHKKHRDFGFVTDNFQAFKLPIKSQNNAFPHDNFTEPTDETFFEGQIDSACNQQTSAKNFGLLANNCNAEKHIKEASEILRDLSETQLNTYHTKYEYQGTSTEILTGLNDSQFNKYPINNGSQATGTSSDATFFDLASFQKDAPAVVGRQTFVDEKLSKLHNSYDVDELPKGCTSTPIIGRLIPQQDQDVGMTEIPVTPKSDLSNSELSQDIVELMDDFPTVSVFNADYFNSVLELIDDTGSFPNQTCPADYTSISLPIEITEELVDLRLSTPSSEINFILEQTSGQTYNGHQEKNLVDNKHKRILSPENFGESKKRRVTDPRSTHRVRPIGKPPISKIKKGTPLTPCHPMKLRTPTIRPSGETPKSFVPKIVASTSGARAKKQDGEIQKTFHQSLELSANQNEKMLRKKRSDEDSDYINTSINTVIWNPGKEKTPRRTPRRVQNKAPSSGYPCLRGKKVSKTPSSFCLKEPVLFNQETKITGRRKEIIQINSEPFTRGSRSAHKGNGWSADKYFPKESSRFAGKTCTDTKKRAISSRRKPCGKAQITMQGSSYTQLDKDEAHLRTIRKKLIDIIFEETSISKKRAENMRSEIREKQQNIVQWNRTDIADGQVRSRVDELVLLCDNLLYQIDSLVANSSGDCRNKTSDETNYSVSQRDEVMSQSRKSMRSMSRRNSDAAVVSKKWNLGGATVNPRQRKKKTQTDPDVNVEKMRPEFSRNLKDGTLRLKCPRLQPIKLLSSEELREDTLPEQIIFKSRGGNADFGFAETTEENFATDVCRRACACSASLPKTVVDVGTNTDLVEPERSNDKKMEEKIFVNRGTNTDPQDFTRADERKKLVECGTNTEFIMGAGSKPVSRDGRKIPNSGNKENFVPKLDLKSIKGIWLPSPTDFTPCSYDQILPDIFANRNFKLPKELEDDLTWDSD